jgi:hypothetical protein
VVEDEEAVGDFLVLDRVTFAATLTLLAFIRGLNLLSFNFFVYRKIES